MLQVRDIDRLGVVEATLLSGVVFAEPILVMVQRPREGLSIHLQRVLGRVGSTGAVQRLLAPLVAGGRDRLCELPFFVSSGGRVGSLHLAAELLLLAGAEMLIHDGVKCCFLRQHIEVGHELS